MARLVACTPPLSPLTPRHASRLLGYGFGSNNDGGDGDGDEGEKGGEGEAAGEAADTARGGGEDTGEDAGEGWDHPQVTIQPASAAAEAAAGLAPPPRPLPTTTAPASSRAPPTAPPPPPRLVVTSIAEYAATAMAIAHNPALRLRISRALLSRLPALLDNPYHADRAVVDWRKFLFGAVAKAAREGRTRTMAPPAAGAGQGKEVKAAPRFPPAGTH